MHPSADRLHRWPGWPAGSNWSICCSSRRRAASAVTSRCCVGPSRTRLGTGRRWSPTASPARLVVETDLALPRRFGELELRGSGVWADHICEDPLVHWSYGLEAFGARPRQSRRGIGRPATPLWIPRRGARRTGAARVRPRMGGDWCGADAARRRLRPPGPGSRRDPPRRGLPTTSTDGACGSDAGAVGARRSRHLGAGGPDGLGSVAAVRRDDGAWLSVRCRRRRMGRYQRCNGPRRRGVRRGCGARSAPPARVGSAGGRQRRRKSRGEARPQSKPSDTTVITRARAPDEVHRRGHDRDAVGVGVDPDR